MDWETKLIKVYFLVSEYSWIFDVYNERYSHNNTPKFTDIEVARNSKCYLDSAYYDLKNKDFIFEEYNVTICAIAKRKRGQKVLFADLKYQNTAISRLRQPIEGFFNWLIQKTGIQNASKTRATKGVLSHVYGKIAASAVFLALFINF